MPRGGPAASRSRNPGGRSPLPHWRYALALALTALFAGAPGTSAQQSTHLPIGPFELLLLPTNTTPQAAGHARLVFAHSPFGIAMTADGHAIYDVQVTAEGLPSPATLGRYSTWVAWAATPELDQWVRLGAVQNGTTTVGPVQYDKFLLVITAEATASPASRSGPTALHGASPSALLQSFLTHPLFRNAR